MGLHRDIALSVETLDEVSVKALDIFAQDLNEFKLDLTKMLDSYYAHDENWLDLEEDMLSASEKWPTVVFVVEVTEGNGEVWKGYFKDGEKQILDGQVVFAPYDPTWKAKLIAAAPDLLEACKDAKRMYEEIQPVGGWQHVFDALNNAINKAEK